MLLLRKSKKATAAASSLDAIRSHMAEAMIGRTVDLMAGSKTILHGVVTGVLNEAGKPKIVVDGHRYDLNQILTALPASPN